MNLDIMVEDVPVRIPPPDTMTTVYHCGDITEINTVANQHNPFLYWRKTSKNTSVNILTGEIITYQNTKNRSDNLHGLRKSFKDLRRIINLNFSGGESELFLTLTYNTNMTNQEQIKHDIQILIKRLRHINSSLEYVSIVEPQQSGSFHAHLLLKDPNNNRLFFSKAELNKIWSHGTAHVKRLYSVDNLGAYFTACLTNSKSTNYGKSKSKKYIKGSRMKYYPAKFRLYRCSKGIQRPKAVKMKYSDAKKLVVGLMPYYARTKSIKTKIDDGTLREINSITYEQFNHKRIEKKPLFLRKVGMSQAKRRDPSAAR